MRKYNNIIILMLVPTNKHIFTLLEKKLQYAEEFNNSIKIDFSKIKDFSEIQDPSKIKRCLNQHCGVILSIFDKPTLLSLKDYIDNYQAFTENERINTKQLNVDKKEQSVWICRFCGRHQIINTEAAEFIEKPTKFLLDNQVGKNNQQPIVLFVIDTSSSMQQCYMSLENKKSNQSLLSLVENSQLVKKNRMRETEHLRKISRMHSGGEVSLPKNRVTKKQLLLGLVSKVVKQMRIKVKSEKNQEKRKIGFVFFNQNIFLIGDGKNNNFPILVDTNYQTSEFNADHYLDKDLAPERFRRTNFNRFQELFHAGMEYSQLYNTSIKSLNIEDMNLKEVCSSGKTALGPALAVSLGIVSKCSHGSTIVIVTDGKANHGILESENPDTESYNLIQKYLIDLKCSLGLLQWKQNQSNEMEMTREKQSQKSISYNKSKISRNNENSNQNNNNYMDKFIKKNYQIIKKIQVTLEMDSETIETNSQALLTLAFKKVVAVAHQIKFISNKDFIEFEKSKFEQTLLNQINLIQSDKTVWVNIRLNKKKIEEEDYQYPVCTQFLLKYHDVQTEKTYCFVSQIEQTLEKSFKKIVQYVNFANLQQYFDNEDIKNYSQKNSIRSCQKTIRDYVRDESMSFKAKHQLQFMQINKSNDSIKRNIKYKQF